MFTLLPVARLFHFPFVPILWLVAHRSNQDRKRIWFRHLYERRFYAWHRHCVCGYYSRREECDIECAKSSLYTSSSSKRMNIFFTLSPLCSSRVTIYLRYILLPFEIDVDCNLIRKTCALEALDEKIVQTFRIFHYLEHKIDDWKLWSIFQVILLSKEKIWNSVERLKLQVSSFQFFIIQMLNDVQWWGRETIQILENFLNIFRIIWTNFFPRV